MATKKFCSPYLGWFVGTICGFRSLKYGVCKIGETEVRIERYLSSLFFFYFLFFGLNAFVRSCLDLNDLTYISLSLDKYESKNEMITSQFTG